MKRWLLYLVTVMLLAAVPPFLVESPLHARTLSVAGICLLIWLNELAPPFVPTLLLWAAIPIFLLPLDARFTIAQVLSWCADPVLSLFFGGLVLGVATVRQGLGKKFVQDRSQAATKIKFQAAVKPPNSAQTLFSPIVPRIHFLVYPYSDVRLKYARPPELYLRHHAFLI